MNIISRVDHNYVWGMSYTVAELQDLRQELWDLSSECGGDMSDRYPRIWEILNGISQPAN